MIECPNRERLLAYLDGVATPDEKAHVAGCPHCQGSATSIINSLEESLSAEVRRIARAGL